MERLDWTAGYPTKETIRSVLDPEIFTNVASRIECRQMEESMEEQQQDGAMCWHTHNFVSPSVWRLSKVTLQGCLGASEAEKAWHEVQFAEINIHC